MAEENREPDYRFTLANERTFLAWMRTALALVAGGFAARELIDSIEPQILRPVLALTCLATALLIAGCAYLQWSRVQTAIRRNRPLPRSPLMPILAGGVAVAAGLGLWAAVAP